MQNIAIRDKIILTTITCLIIFSYAVGFMFSENSAGGAIVDFEFVKKNKTIGYYFARECHYNGYKCLRIVDFFGNIKKIFDSSAPFKKIIETNNYEFVDLFFYGNIKNKSYFLKNNFKNNIIIPNYFEPFLKKNITINFAIMSIKNSSKLYLFKGDCDQENENIPIYFF